MGLFFVYILKSSVCLAVFYLFYRLLLSRETFHRFNRFALLGILLLSCLLPLVEVSVKQETEIRQTVLTLEQLLMMADAMNAAENGVTAEAETVTWVQVLLLVYLAGVVFFAFRNACSLVRLWRLLKSGTREDIGRYLPGRRERVTLVVHRRGMAPFSWMGTVVISRDDLEENGREILIHELAHIRSRHSWDLLLADVCIFFQWFNPASWLLRQELQNIHEYEADETVIKEGVDARQYQLLLIKKAVGTRLYSMANSFNHSKLKKRITMMLKEKSSPWARLKYLYVLPVAAVAVTAFARPEVSDKVEEISSVKVNDLAAIVETKVAESVDLPSATRKDAPMVADTTKPAKVKHVPIEVKEPSEGIPVFDAAEVMPEFPGGMPALMQYLRENLRYPEAARKEGMQGRVTVQFVVDEDGSIKEPKVLRPVDKDMDAEALRLISSMPKWKPGMQKGQPVAVKYTVPVLFRLDDDKSGKASSTGTAEGTVAGKGKEPLYMVDGKEVAPSVVSALNPDKIASITVLKDESATAQYVEKGKNGVLLITLKKGDDTGMPEKDIEVVSVGTAMKVKGKVVDEQGAPVVGACILAEGTKTGSVTDTGGHFALSVPSKDAVLVVSYIGMATAKVKAQPELTVTLKSE